MLSVRTLIRTFARFASASLVLALAATAAQAQNWLPENGIVVKGTVLTQDAQHTVIEDGRVCVKGTRIEAVLRPGDALPSGFEQAPVIDTRGGVIMPGMINAHNHIAYNFLELWQAPRAYANRYQWTNPESYKLDINYPKKIVCEPGYYNMAIEACKYAEIKELVGGTTSTQGSPPSGSGFNRMLVRNIDFGLDVDDVRQHGLSIADGRFAEDAGTLAQQMANGRVGAWLVHVAEGIDEASRAEFGILKTLGLLREQTVIIHGTALGDAEFREMAEVGADLVWSPLSNRLLYGKTTDIVAARRAGVNVSLASDWSPSGSKNLLGELKIADEIDNNEWGNVLSYRDLVDMVTVNPAKALHWDNRVGRIVAGHYADLVVIDRRGDPYASVVHATDRNVQLVLVGGDPLYGDDGHMARLKGTDREGFYDRASRTKSIDVTKAGDPKSTQTWRDIIGALNRALAFDHDDMRRTFRETVALTPEAFEIWLRAKFPGLKPVTLDPVYTENDARWFTMIQGSANARMPYDLMGYWHRSDAPISLGRGVIGGSVKAGQSAAVARAPRGSYLRDRLPYGTPVEVVEYKVFSALSQWVHVRATVNGRRIDGWVVKRAVVSG